MNRTWQRRRAYNTAMFWLCCSEFRELEVHSLGKKNKLRGIPKLVLVVRQHSEGTIIQMHGAVRSMFVLFTIEFGASFLESWLECLGRGY